MKLATAACLVAVALLAHAPALDPDAKYTYDDHIIVEQNPRLFLRSAGDLLDLVKSNWWGEASARSGEKLFRPVPLVTYAVERTLVGAPHPWLARAINVLLHAATVLVACALFAQVARDERTGLIAAAIFAAHPLHSEAVAGIVGRAEVLALLFGMGALVLHGRGTWRAAPLAGLLFLLALGSKESAVAILPIAVARDLLERHDRARRYPVLGALVVALVAYVALRAWALDALIAGPGAMVAGPGARTLGDMSLDGRARVALAVYREAWRATLVPLFGTAAHYPFPDRTPVRLAAAALIQVSLVTAVLSLRWSGTRGRAIALGIIGFEAALLPVANLIPIGVVFAERLLYAPTAWASLALGALVPRHRAARVGVALLVGLLAFESARNDHAWRDDLALWRATHARFPDEARIQEIRGELELAQGNSGLAVALLESATAGYQRRRHPLEAKTAAMLARALRRADRARSEALFDRARRVDPMNGNVWLELARVRIEEGDDRGALEAAERAVAHAPERPDSYALLGLAQLRTGDPRSAIDSFTREAVRSSNPGQALVNRAEALWSLGDRKTALADYRAAAAALGGDWHLRLIVRLAEAGERAEARERWKPLRARVSPEVRARIDGLLGL